MPVMLILFGSAFQLFFKLTKNIIVKILIIILLILIIGSNLLFEFYFYQYLTNKKIIDGNYGTIYSVTKNYVESQIKNK